MQPNKLDEFHVFLASPGDVGEERKVVREFFESVNRSSARNWNIHFTVVDWEGYSTIGVGRPQELITSQTLERFRDSLALVIGIMAQKFGSPTGTHDSGTEEEFEWALDSNIRTGFPEIKWFFRDVKRFEAPPDISQIESALEQWKKVAAFKKKFEESEPPIFYQPWSDHSDFKDRLREDLNLWLNSQDRPWFGEINRAQETKEIEAYSDLPQAYYESLEQTFKSLDIRGIDNDKAVDIPLSDVYVRLRVIRDEDADTDEEDQDFGELNIHDALSKFQRLVIVGDPGSGKSTFLKYIALILAQSTLAKDPSIAVAKLNIEAPLPTPLFISLWDLSDFLRLNTFPSNVAIFEFLASRLKENNIFLTTDELTRLVQNGNCCLLFDGLDEVPTEQGRAFISRLLENFVSQYSKSRYVITSRVRGYTGDAILKNEFVRCDIQDFDRNDRSEFLRNWFSALFRVDREEVAKVGTKSNREFTELFESIEAKDRIRALAVNPLLMTVIAIVHWNRKRLPDQRVDLYDECVDVLLGQRKIAERIGRGGTSHLLDEEAENEIHYDRAWTRKRFGEIALLILQSGEDEETTRESVVALLTPRFADRDSQSKERAEHRAESFIESQELKSGLLVSRRSRSCRFVHLTFQEYLAAWSLANQNFDDVKGVIQTNLRNPQWFETLQLLGGELAKNSDEKLDEFALFLLENIGFEIGDQAPVIALCANILSDVKGVADIKSTTNDAYTNALRGTLDAFKPDSGVPANTQLEVLRALSQLGASVKEHLIQATKSSNFQVRSAALEMLVVHLSDDDLFRMEHIFNDRSQETIAVYLRSLMQRDRPRTITLINVRTGFNIKDCKGLCILFDECFHELSDSEVLRIMSILFKLHGRGNSRYFLKLISIVNKRISLRNALKETIFSEQGWWPVDVIASDYYDDDDIWVYFSELATGSGRNTSSYARLRAFYFLTLSSGKFVGSWEVMATVATNDKDLSIRTYATRLLVNKYIKKDLFEHKILTLFLNGRPPYVDLARPIDQKWVARCASNLARSESIIWESFEHMATILPLTLRREGIDTEKRIDSEGS